MRVLLGAKSVRFDACPWSGWAQSVRLLGACIWRVLGAKYAVVGCMETFRCMYAVFGCMSMERFGACLTVGIPA